jgi:hypothetical protein
MACSEQQTALGKVQAIWGRNSFTDDHLNYRRVGMTRDKQTFCAVGDTWDEAIESLKVKVSQ